MDSVYTKLIEHDRRFDQHDQRIGRVEAEIKEFREEFRVFRQENQSTLDGVMTILQRLDQERIFTIEWVRRIEGDVDRVKKVLRLS